MPSIEDRIVRIEFDNAQFERDIESTLASLADLNEGLGLAGAEEGIASLSSIAQTVDSLGGKFTAMGAIAFSVIQSITQSALGMVKKIGGDILAPIISGGSARAKNIEQAKFMFEGLGIDIEAGMASALDAVRGTAFGLDEAAKAAAQFGASGIQVGDEMTGALRGVAGAAAMTGSSFTEMADIFAGSAGTGKVTNMDLMQFATRGLNAAAALGKQMGITEAQVHEMAGAGELDFKTFATAMDGAFGQHATSANKTYTGALANMKAGLSRLGASAITPQLVQQRDLFNVLTPVIDKVTSALQPLFLVFTMITGVLRANLMWKLASLDFEPLKKAVGFVAIGMANLFKVFQRLVEIGKSAFSEIFPPGTESVIVKIAAAFQKFSEWLLFSSNTAMIIKRIFMGVFAILSIGWTIIKEGIRFIFDLGKALMGLGGPGFSEIVAKIADFFVGLQEFLVKGGGIKSFFETLGGVIAVPVTWILKLKNAIARMFGGFDEKKADALNAVTGRLSDRFDSLRQAMDRIKDMWRPFGEFFDKVGEILGKTWEVISDFFSNLFSKIAETMSGGNYDRVLDTLNTGLFAVITAAIVKWWKSGFKLNIGGSFIESIREAFGQLTNTLKALQIQIKAEAIRKIAIAIAILTASVLVLSLIDSAALTKALIAMSVGFGQLMGAFYLLTKMTLDPRTAFSFTILAAGMILLGIAMIGLAIAATILSKLSWGELAKGLLGVLALVGIMAIAAKLLRGSTPSLIAAGIGIGILSVGLMLLGLAVKIFASMSWGELSRGLLGLAVGLGLIIAALLLMPPHMALLGLGMFTLGIGLNAMAGAIKIFGGMSWDEIGRGLAALAGGLLIIAAAMYAMPDGMMRIGVGLILVGIGLNIFAKALKAMGAMSWGEIGKSLVILAGSLIILAVGVTAMSGSLGGAFALVVVSGALLVLAGVLKVMAKLDWDDLIQGLLKMAAAIGGIALVAYLVGPAIPFIMGLGVALAIIGVAFLLFGAGAMLAAKAFEMLAKAGKKGAETLPHILQALGEALPAFGRGLAKGLLETIKTFADGIASLIPSLAKIIGAIITAIQQNLPKFMETFTQLLDAFLLVVYEYGPQLIGAGLFMLVTMLQGIRDNIGEIVTIVADIIINFFKALEKKVPELVDSVYNFIMAVIEAVAIKIQQAPLDMLKIIGKAYMSGMFGGILEKALEIGAWLLAFPGVIIGWIGNAAKWLLQKGKDVIQGLWDGAIEIFNQVATWVGGIPGALVGLIGNPLTALKETGKDLIRGFKNGLEAIWEQVEKWIKSALDHLPGIVKKALGIESPSKVFKALGSLTSEGYFIGLKDTWEARVGDAFPTDALITTLNDSIRTIVSVANDGLSDVGEFNPVITPVLDFTRVKADAALIGGYIQTSQKISPNVSLNHARVIASSKTAAATAAQQQDGKNAAAESSGVVFNQTINAPTRLATADIYKQTRNQITIAKEELAIP